MSRCFSRLISVFAVSGFAFLGTYLTGCAQTDTSKQAEPLPHIDTLKRHHDDHEHYDDEILVLDPPKGYLESLPALGLSVAEVTHLDALNLDLYHLKIDNGAHPFHARHLHAKKHPDILVDVHHHFEQHAKRKRKRKSSLVSRQVIQWGKAKPGC